MFTVYETAELMEKPVRHIRYLIDMGYLEAIKARNTIRISMGGIEEYYAEFGNGKRIIAASCNNDSSGSFASAFDFTGDSLPDDLQQRALCIQSRRRKPVEHKQIRSNKILQRKPIEIKQLTFSFY